MEMKKQKKIIGGMILVLAVTACASFFKSAAEEIAQEETSEIYQNEIKPKNNAASAKEDGKKIFGWRCKICNYVYEGSKLPEDYDCQLCGHGADDFEPIYES